MPPKFQQLQPPLSTDAAAAAAAPTRGTRNPERRKRRGDSNGGDASDESDADDDNDDDDVDSDSDDDDNDTKKREKKNRMVSRSVAAKLIWERFPCLQDAAKTISRDFTWIRAGANSLIGYILAVHSMSDKTLREIRDSVALTNESATKKEETAAKEKKKEEEEPEEKELNPACYAALAVWQTALDDADCKNKIITCLDAFGLGDRPRHVLEGCIELVKDAKRLRPAAPFPNFGVDNDAFLAEDGALAALDDAERPMQWSFILRDAAHSMMLSEFRRCAKNVKVYLRNFIEARMPKDRVDAVYNCLVSDDPKMMDARATNNAAAALAGKLKLGKGECFDGLISKSRKSFSALLYVLIKSQKLRALARLHNYRVAIENKQPQQQPQQNFKKRYVKLWDVVPVIDLTSYQAVPFSGFSSKCLAFFYQRNFAVEATTANFGGVSLKPVKSAAQICKTPLDQLYHFLIHGVLNKQKCGVNLFALNGLGNETPKKVTKTDKAKRLLLRPLSDEATSSIHAVPALGAPEREAFDTALKTLFSSDKIMFRTNGFSLQLLLDVECLRRVQIEKRYGPHQLAEKSFANEMHQFRADDRKLFDLMQRMATPTTPAAAAASSQEDQPPSTQEAAIKVVAAIDPGDQSARIIKYAWNNTLTREQNLEIVKQLFSVRDAKHQENCATVMLPKAPLLPLSIFSRFDQPKFRFKPYRRYFAAQNRAIGAAVELSAASVANSRDVYADPLLQAGSVFSQASNNLNRGLQLADVSLAEERKIAYRLAQQKWLLNAVNTILLNPAWKEGGKTPGVKKYLKNTEVLVFFGSWYRRPGQCGFTNGAHGRFNTIWFRKQMKMRLPLLIPIEEYWTSSHCVRCGAMPLKTRNDHCCRIATEIAAREAQQKSPQQQQDIALAHTHLRSMMKLGRSEITDTQQFCVALRSAEVALQMFDSPEKRDQLRIKLAELDELAAKDLTTTKMMLPIAKRPDRNAPAAQQAAPPVQQTAPPTSSSSGGGASNVVDDDDEKYAKDYSSTLRQADSLRDVFRSVGARYANCDAALARPRLIPFPPAEFDASMRTQRRKEQRKRQHCEQNRVKLAESKEATQQRLKDETHVHRVVECRCCGTRRQRDDHACDNLLLLALYMLAFGFDARPAHLPKAKRT